MLWPVPVYKKNVGSDPPKNIVKTITHNGTKIRGVVRELSEGRPIGSYLLEQVGRKGFKLEKIVEDSTRAVRGVAQVADTFALAQSKTKITTTVSKDGDVLVAAAAQDARVTSCDVFF